MNIVKLILTVHVLRLKYTSEDRYMLKKYLLSIK